MPCGATTAGVVSGKGQFAGTALAGKAGAAAVAPLAAGDRTDSAAHIAATRMRRDGAMRQRYTVMF